MLSDFDTCPLDAADNSSYVLAGSVIDTRPYEPKDGGDIVKVQKRLLVLKAKAREKMVRMIESKGDLQYAVVEFSRGSSATECSTGEDFSFIKQLTKDQVKQLIPKKETAKWLDPYDYKKIFEPKSPEELRKLIGAAPPVGSAEETEDEKEKETVSSKEVDSIEDLL